MSNTALAVNSGQADCTERALNYSLTEIEESIPGPAEFQPGFWNKGAEPFGDGSSIHGSLEHAEHEFQGLDVVHSGLWDVGIQAAQTTLKNDSGHAYMRKSLETPFFQIIYSINTLAYEYLCL